MGSVALCVTLDARPGCEKEVESLLRSAPAMMPDMADSGWIAVRMGPSRYGIFDASAHDAGGQADVAERIAVALFEWAPDLFLEPHPRRR